MPVRASSDTYTFAPVRRARHQINLSCVSTRHAQPLVSRHGSDVLRGHSSSARRYVKPYSAAVAAIATSVTYI